MKAQKLFSIIALFIILGAPLKVFAAHGEGASWVENSNLAGCEHCHDTIIEWDTGETRQITNRDENIAVNGGRPSQTHMIVNMALESGRTRAIGDCNRRGEVCDPNSEIAGLWNDVVNFMTEKEPTPVPYNELTTKTYLDNCYENVAASQYAGCPTGPGTVDDNCNCGPPPTTTTSSTTSTTSTTTSTTSTTITIGTTSTSTSSSTTSTTVTIGTTTTSTSSSTTSTSSTTTTTLLVSFADLALTISDSPDPVVGGAPLIYTYTGVNNGPDGAVNVRILSNYSEPPNSISTSRGTCGLSSPPTVTRPSRPRPVPATYLTCEVGSLGSGENVVVTVQVTASAGTQSNGASIQGSVTDPDLTNNSDAEATTVLGIPTTQRIRPTIIRPPRPTIIRPSRGETTSTTSTTTSSTTSTTVAP